MRLTDLGEYVAAVQDAERERRQLTNGAAERYIAAVRRKPRRNPLPLLLAAAFLSVVALTTVVVLRRAERPIETATLTSPAIVGRPFVAPKDQSIPVSFPDGSRLVLASGTHASVKELSAQGAKIALERGKAQMSVVHHALTNYALHAGPYQVSVIGTRFELEWIPERDRFELWLAEGSVVVTIDLGSHAAVRMQASDHLVIDHGHWQLNSNNSPVEPQTAPLLPVAPPAAQSLPKAGSATDATAADSANEVTNAPPNWLRLSRLGKYESAYNEAERLNIATLAQSGSAPTLLTLAEVCRFSGHGSNAMLVLTKLRQRFPNTEEAAVAAFQLGRLASSAQHAASFFQKYLNERPSGALAREASGRLLEALDRSGDPQGAIRAARTYLDQYPNGPHAAFAKRVLGN